MDFFWIAIFYPVLKFFVTIIRLVFKLKTKRVMFQNSFSFINNNPVEWFVWCNFLKSESSYFLRCFIQLNLIKIENIISGVRTSEVELLTLLIFHTALSYEIFHSLLKKWKLLFTASFYDFFLLFLGLSSDGFPIFRFLYNF